MQETRFSSLGWEDPLEEEMAIHPSILAWRIPCTEEPLLGYSVVSATAAAKSLQSCPNLGDPRDGSPPGSTVPGILQVRTLEWVAISFFQRSLSGVQSMGSHRVGQTERPNSKQATCLYSSNHAAIMGQSMINHYPEFFVSFYCSKLI